MRVLVTFAVEAEFTPWRARHVFARRKHGQSKQRPQFDVYGTTIGTAEVTVLITGMGGENARNAMRTVPVESQDGCISTGLAGALDSGLRAGEIVVARSVGAFDAKQRIQSDSQLLDFAVDCGGSPVDVFLTSETIVASAERKRALSVSGNVVEMESFHILDVASSFRLPAIAVRAICDMVEDGLPLDFQRVLNSRGKARIGPLVSQLALHPWRTASLVRFGRQSRSAAQSLADFLDRYIPAIANGWDRVSRASMEEVSAT